MGPPLSPESEFTRILYTQNMKKVLTEADAFFVCVCADMSVHSASEYTSHIHLLKHGLELGPRIASPNPHMEITFGIQSSPI